MCSTGRRSTLLFAALVLTALIAPSLSGSSAAAADPFQDARKIFDQAEALYAEGQYGAAADKYTAVYRVMRTPLLFFNIAQARRLQFQQDGDWKNLVLARDQYQRFLDEAEPGPQERARAEANLAEVKTASIEEAKKRFGSAEKAMRLSQFGAAIDDYEAAYQLSGRPGILFNLAQAQRKQFSIDGKLERLARAEELVITYRREGKGEVAEATLEQVLVEIRGDRAAYHRRREAESRSKEPASMREARELYQRGDAAGALAALERAEKVKGNERVVLLQLYRLRAQAAAQVGDRDTAVDALRRYLAIEPAADGTGLSDAATEAFSVAKEFWKGKQPLKLAHLPPGKVPPGAEVEIPIRVESDPLKMIAHRELRYRRQGDKEWQTVALSAGEPVAKLPRTPPPLVGKEYRMEYVVTALDRNRAELHTLGSESAPLAFLVTEDAIVRPPPIYKRWWFWAGVGAVAVGTVTTIAIIKYDGLPDAKLGGNVSSSMVRF